MQQPAGAIWTQQTAWRLSAQPVLQIEGADADIERAPIDPVRVSRLGNGRYLVADGDQRGHHALLVFDAQGRFVMRLGRKGRGPGEFGQLFQWGGTYRGDSIAAYDFIDRAIEVFAPDGRFARALKLPNTRSGVRPPPGTYGASDYFIGPFSDGRVLRFEPAILNISGGPGQVWYEPDLMLYDADGANPRKLATLRTWGQWWDGKKAVSSPLQAVAITVAGKSNWYHGVAEEFNIGVFDSEGRVVRTLRRAFNRQRVTAADQETAIRSLARMFSSGGQHAAQNSPEEIEKRLRAEARFPEFRPAYLHLVEDSDDNVWVQHYGAGAVLDQAGPLPSRWSIFDAQGQFLGELEMPASFRVSTITKDQVLGFWQDEFDVKHVRVYGLIKPQTPGR
ncbi:MAG: 6-bladed beta-propeller [Longimicrobiales bacterium]